jgi:hypothetical protein
MVPALDPGTVNDGAVRGVLVHHLALQDSAVFQREMKDVAVSGVRHRIEPNDSCLAMHALNEVPDAAEIAVAAIQTPHAPDGLPVRQLGHTAALDAKSAPAIGAV